jgi:hypothetical protein
MCDTSHRQIQVAQQRPLDRALSERTLRQLRRHVVKGDAAGTLRDITEAVTDFVVSQDAWAA